MNKFSKKQTVHTLKNLKAHVDLVAHRDIITDEDIGYTPVTVSAIIDGKLETRNFYVQLSDGYFEPQNNCLIWSDSTEGDIDADIDDFDAIEMKLFEALGEGLIVGKAENAYRELTENLYELIPTSYGYGSWDVFLRKNTATNYVELIAENSSHNSAWDYGRRIEVLESFYSMKSAQKYLDEIENDEELSQYGKSRKILKMDDEL